MKTILKHLTIAIAAAAAAACGAAQADTSLNLGRYTVSATYSLDALNGTSGGISGLEASAVAYAKDRNSLFFVGDEGTGVVEATPPRLAAKLRVPLRTSSGTSCLTITKLPPLRGS